MSLVDALVQNPDLYIGADHVQGTDLIGSARMRVTPLPGKFGVSLDYEILNASAPGPILGHVEHTIVAAPIEARLSWSSPTPAPARW